jgi:hypothetical protein
LERLHEGCDSDLAPDFLNFGAGVFFLMLQNRSFFALAPRPGFGAAICSAIM